MPPLLSINRIPASQSETAEALVAGILVLCMALGCLPLVHRYYPHSQTAKRVLLLAGSLAALLALLRPPLPVGGGAECPDLPFGLCPRLWDKGHVPEHEEDDVAIWGEAGACCAAGTTARGMQGIPCWSGCTFRLHWLACRAPQTQPPALIPTPFAPLLPLPPGDGLRRRTHWPLWFMLGSAFLGVTAMTQTSRGVLSALLRTVQVGCASCALYLIAPVAPTVQPPLAVFRALACVRLLFILHATTQRLNAALPCPLCYSGGGQCGHGGGLPRPRVLPGAAAGAGGWGRVPCATGATPAVLWKTNRPACLPVPFHLLILLLTCNIQPRLLLSPSSPSPRSSSWPARCWPLCSWCCCSCPCPEAHSSCPASRWPGRPACRWRWRRRPPRPCRRCRRQQSACCLTRIASWMRSGGTPSGELAGPACDVEVKVRDSQIKQRRDNVQCADLDCWPQGTLQLRIAVTGEFSCSRHAHFYLLPRLHPQ